jgi:glycerol-3-phosphate dehydrogenase
VVPLGFNLTSFRADRMPSWMFGAGLAIYDLIARKWQHEHHEVSELVAKIPALAGSPMTGGYHYYDAQTDDARLVVRLLREAVRIGGTALSYARVTGLLRAKGRVCGVIVTDVADPAARGRTIEVQARAVINATGAWADELRDKIGEKRRLRAIRGSHLVFPAARLPLPEAISLMHPRDGRAVFAIPWEGVTLLGTTDVDHRDGLSAEPSISDDEADYLMEAARQAFPSLSLQLSDVRSSYAGVRPVIDSGAANPAKESREHAVWNEAGLLTVAGGKLTTFRIMAIEALQAVSDVLPTSKIRRGRILPDATLGEALGSDARFDDATRARLLGRHGEDARRVMEAKEGAERIGDSCVLWSELRFAARDEAVVHLDDLLLRRARIGLLVAEGGAAHLDRVGTIVREELGWDDARWTTERARYEAIWRRAYGNPAQR